MQSTNSIFMVRPAAFGYNTDTAGSNAFQQVSVSQTASEVQAAARTEFDGLVEVLRESGVSLHIFEDTADPGKPDAVFPNNWISTHENGTVILYPMQGLNRRPERRRDILDELEQYYEIRKVVDLSHHEAEGRYLEGTGSMTFDRDNGVIYACRSPRTDEKILQEVADELGYSTFVFDAVDANGKPIYHTNVMLAVGTRFSVLAESTLPNKKEREALVAALSEGDRRMVKLRPGQLEQFGGNLLEVHGHERQVVLSSTAYHSLSPSQKDMIELFAGLTHAPVPTIERIGGGSVRCMLCEIFLPRR